MRLSLALSSLSLACASTPQPAATTNPALQCPGSVQVTVSNSDNGDADVYYYEGNRPRTMLGEVAAGRTVTFHLPGEGLGSVRLEQRSGSRVAVSNSRKESQIRIHC